MRRVHHYLLPAETYREARCSSISEAQPRGPVPRVQLPGEMCVPLLVRGMKRSLLSFVGADSAYRV